jgi:hypothetical protein
MHEENPHARGAGASNVLSRNDEASTSNPHGAQPSALAHAAYRRAKATWDLTLYLPEHVGGDLPEALEAELCSAAHSALIVYLTSPAEDASALVRKLCVLRAELGDAGGLYEIDDILGTLIDDARRLATDKEARHG